MASELLTGGFLHALFSSLCQCADANSCKADILPMCLATTLLLFSLGVLRHGWILREEPGCSVHGLDRTHAEQ